MADHEDLVAEMPLLEQLGTQERQKLAKKRRLQQLKKWAQREKEWIAKEKQLNKRLASKLNEENNGLNLKQYTIYNSNQRTKKKLTNQTNNASNNTVTVTSSNVLKNSSATNVIDNKTLQNIPSNEININNNNIIVVDGPFTNRHEKTLTPNGKVHFDVGVMLLEAAARNDFDEVKRLLSLGVSPDSINHDGLTALHQCCIDASEPMMNLLLEFGANVDARDTERWTPLHAACTCGHLNLVKILVDYGADLLAVNGDGNMPFDICEEEETLNYIESQMVMRGITQEMIDETRASVERQMLNELERLVEQDKVDELNGADQMGVTPLHVASSNNYLSVVKFLLKHDVNVNVCDNDQWRPLHGVACWGNEQHVKIVELLVEAGASLDAKTQNDETVFDLCDNFDLLERLNQLKDELENKQASGTDRLRRTQSRTNSRVHSVRRTSVRDKNQISRREAREEAMLRVESETSLPPNSQAGQQIVTNGTAATTTTSLSLSTTSQQVAPPTNGQTSPTSQKSMIVVVAGQQQQAHIETNLDQIDGLDSSNDLKNGQEMKEDNKHHHQNGSQLSQDISQNKSTKVSEIVGLNNEPIMNHDSSEDQVNNVVTGTRLIVEEEQRQQVKDMANETISVTLGGNFQPATSTNMTTTVNHNSGSPHQRSLSQTTTVQVQYAPINYTLSNLKKHRSDLRMRTGTIGGHTSSGSGSSQGDASKLTGGFNGLAVISATDLGSHTPNGHGNHSFASLPVDVKSFVAKTKTPTCIVQLHPEPIDSTDNGIQRRPESPGQTTFRKFHGEPSEVIGCNVGRKRRHLRCCILI